MSQYYRDLRSNETIVSWKALHVKGMKKPINVEAFAVIDAATRRMLKIDIVHLAFTDGSHPSYELRPVLAAINEASDGGYWYDEVF